MLAKGEVVGDFALNDQHGDTQSLHDLLQVGPLVLFFMQRVMTPG